MSEILEGGTYRLFDKAGIHPLILRQVLLAGLPLRKFISSTRKYYGKLLHPDINQAETNISEINGALSELANLGDEELMIAAQRYSEGVTRVEAKGLKHINLKLREELARTRKEISKHAKEIASDEIAKYEIEMKRLRREISRLRETNKTPSNSSKGYESSLLDDEENIEEKNPFERDFS